MELSKDIMIIILSAIIIINTIMTIAPPHKVKKNEILYTRFQVESVIHNRLIIVKDMETDQLYWMIRDYKWLIAAPYINKKN